MKKSNTKVVHINSKFGYDVYIGRGSKWGNPFKINNDYGSTREFVIQQYEKYITEGKGMHLLNDLHELKGKVLACYCSPKPCHGDVLIKLIEEGF